MSNILDYLDWRGDLDFSTDPINEVDNLVLSVLSYLDFAGVVPTPDESDSVSLADAAEAIKRMPDQITAPVTSAFSRACRYCWRSARLQPAFRTCASRIT